MKKKIYLELLFLALLGALTSLSLPPYNYLFINFITLSIFFIFIIKKKKLPDEKNSYFYGWSFGFGYFLTNLYWIPISLTFDDNFQFLIPFALILIPAFLAIFYGLATYLFFLFNLKKLLSSFFLFSLLFGLMEFIRGTILTGFPWNLFAYSFSNNIEIIQIISVVGTYAFNMLCISFFLSPAIFILRENKKAILVSIFFLLSPIVLYINGSAKIKNFSLLDIKENEFLIRIVGSNIELKRFYGNTETTPVINELIDLSNPNLDKQTLFIWPEGIIPNINQSELDEYKNLFKDKFNKNHLFGLGINNYEVKNGEGKFYNTFSFYDHEINLIAAYNKVNLVPFGEFLPFENFLRTIGMKSLTNNYQSYTKGKSRNLIKIGHNDFTFNFLPLICYEIIYSGKILNNPEIDYIINISEDGWFGNSIGPKQHFIHSIFRAVESRKYIIRSANNGISAIINPVGLIEKEIPQGKSGHIDFTEKRKMDPNMFSTFGNKMFLLTILLYIFLIISFNRMQ